MSAPLHPDDRPSHAELEAERLADALDAPSPVADWSENRDPYELLPAGEPPRCLYADERDLLQRATLTLDRRDGRPAPLLTLYREDTLALVHALDRLGALRLRRALDLGDPSPDEVDG